MRPYHLTALSIFVGVLLTACAGTSTDKKPESYAVLRQAEASGIDPIGQEAGLAEVNASRSGEIADRDAEPSSSAALGQKWPDGDVQQDGQGFVEVAISPLNLNAPGESLNFNVSLNTHSVDLSMDLAELATLETDNGLRVGALAWDAPRGGHHVSGVLSFPAQDGNGPLLQAATRLTLKVVNLDAPERTFTWSLID